MRLKRFAYALFFTSALTGCMVGQDYHMPSFSLPASWHEHTPDKANIAVRDSKVTWWQDFDDPTLNTLIERALANNEDLKTAAARITEARGTQESTGGALFPQLSGSGQFVRGNPGTTTLGGDLSQYGGEFDALWEIDLFGGTRRKIEAQNALVGLEEAAYRNASLSLSAEVAREYIMLRQFQSQMAITRQTADTQRHLYSITQDHYKGGLVSTLDVSQAETLYKTTEARLPDFERQITASSYRLSILLGENPGSLDSLVKRSQPIPVAEHLPVLDAPADILRQRPDVAVAERNLAAVTALHAVAVSELYPKVSLAGFFGIQRGVLPVLHYASTENIWAVAPTVSMPILEFGTIRGQINAADARQVQAFHQYRQIVLSALGDVETDLSNLTKESQRHKVLRDAGNSAEHAVSVARDRYKSGLSDFTTVLQAEQQRFAVQIDLIASQSAVAQDIIALHKALGENPAPAAADKR